MFTFKADEDLDGDVRVFGDAVASAASDDDGSAGLFTIDGRELKRTTETVFLVLEIEEAVAGTEMVGLDVS